MATAREVVGKAVALKRGHYFTPAGGYIIVAEGEVFSLLKGLETSRWFRRVDDKAALPPPPPPEPQLVGQGKRGRAKPPPIDDDIA
jgi:hypothetical protein